MHLQQLPLPDEIAIRHRLEAERLWLAAAPGLVPLSSVSPRSRESRLKTTILNSDLVEQR